MAKDWEKYWLYLESYTFIFKGDDKTVLYNTLNSAYIECPSNDLIMYAIDSLFNSENYCIKISSEEYNDPEFYNFINIIRESFSGDCIPCNETANKPFIFKPILRLNDNFHKLESEDRIIEGHNILYYLNELSLYITDLCTLQCHHCADYNKQVLFCRKGNASADFPFKELDKILLHLSTSNIAKINFLGGNIFQYKYMQELINTIGEYRFKSHFFTHIEHINKHSVEIIKKILAKKGSFTILIPTITTDISLKKYIDNENIEYTLMVDSEESLSKAINIVTTNPLAKINIRPFFNGSNMAFFKENVFMDLNDLLSSPISKKSIFRHQVLNENFFGKMIIMPNGETYSNINHNSLGNAFDDILSINKLVYTSNPQLSSSASFLRLNVLSSLN
jgi:pseudo-rSAM protein